MFKRVFDIYLTAVNCQFYEFDSTLELNDINNIKYINKINKIIV